MSWLSVLLIVFILHGVTLSFFVLLEQRKPTATLAWILILLLVPFVGALCYYLFGRMRFVRRQRLRARALTKLDFELAALEREEEQENEESPFRKPLDVSVSPMSPWLSAGGAGDQGGPQGVEVLGVPAQIELDEEQEQSRSLIMLGQRLVDMPLADGNSLELLDDAEQAYASIAASIREAKHHVHVAYYIVRIDETGLWFRDLLIERAKAGVEVRFLYDWVGSYEINQAFLQPLLDAGVKCAAFLPLRFQWKLRRSYVNFRNHRKIVIVDGREGFTGGINIGDEYRGLDERIGFWRDSHVKLAGPAVRQLQQVFVEDWCYTTNDMLLEADYYPAWPIKRGEELVQMISSGPDHPWYAIHLLFFSAITSAREKVWITTPYFVPDDSIMTALTTAALRGVDVRLILPGKTDQQLVLYAGRSYYRDLLRAGVRIYEYQRGMLHAKTMVVDGLRGSIGSANMDIRSFHLNFELNAFVYSSPFAASLEETFLKDLQDCTEIDLISFVRRPLSQRVLEASSRLLSPLL